MRAVRRVLDDLVILRQMLRGMPKAGSHADRLQAFYSPQATRYDEFRDRLLPGRAEMIRRLPLPARASVVELGAGTGRNLGFFGARLDDIASFDLVDLCPALLEHVAVRATRATSIRAVQGDATNYRPGELVDCVYFSYALTMIPDWKAALSNAHAMLKPGGTLGVVDFYIAPTTAKPGRVRHGWLRRTFWRQWFAHDGVHLNADHLATLERLFPQHTMIEHDARLPYLPGLRVPYYIFIGRKCGLDGSMRLADR